jgi:hypothetical protein
LGGSLYALREGSKIDAKKYAKERADTVDKEDAQSVV